MPARYIQLPGWGVPTGYYRNHPLAPAAQTLDYGFFNPAKRFAPLQMIDSQFSGDDTPSVIIAHSMGTMFALRAATLYRQIKALVLVSPFARFAEDSEYGGQPPRVIKAMRAQLRREPETLLENFYSAMAAPEFINFSREPALNIAALNEGLECLMKFDVRDILDQVKCPVLMIQGGMDNISGHGQANYLAERLRNGTMKTFADAGHAVIFTRSEECRRLVAAFISKVL